MSRFVGALRPSPATRTLRPSSVATRTLRSSGAARRWLSSYDGDAPPPKLEAAQLRSQLQKRLQRMPHEELLKWTLAQQDAIREQRGRHSEQLRRVQAAEDTVADTGRPKFNILSLDGGGVRGCFTATVLERLEQRHPGFVDQFDMVAGTSTGGIIALSLAMGHSAAECRSFYEEFTHEIFKPDFMRGLSPWHAKYSDTRKAELFRMLFKGKGMETFADLKKWVLLTSFRVDGRVPDDHESQTFFPSGRWRPALFSNIPRNAGLVEPDLDWPLFDAAMATTAAPTYFPLHQGYVDGGVFGNNPSLAAVAKAASHFPELRPTDINVLSIGTCIRPLKLDAGTASGKEGDWGLSQWSPHLLNLVFDSSNRSVSLYQQMLLGDRYHRINPLLGEDVGLDDINAIDLMIRIGNQVDLAPADLWLDELEANKHLRPDWHNRAHM